jgi:hypothetical protein
MKCGHFWTEFFNIQYLAKFKFKAKTQHCIKKLDKKAQIIVLGFSLELSL